MLGVLNDILCVLTNLVLGVLWALCSVINFVILALGVFIQAIAALLPSMPSDPAAPSSGILGAINWVVPLGPLVAALATFVSLWLAFVLIRIPLKWAKIL